MTDQEKRDFYKNCIAEMLNGIKRIDILQYVYIITENIIKEEASDEHYKED